ncbi:MAG: T9SS type A sorting domain-containing protein [Candidatus Glassbacteria bacterium]
MKRKEKLGISVLLAGLLMIFTFSSSGNVFADEWEQIGLAGKMIRGVALHPDTPDTIFIVADDSIFRSMDGGDTYEVVFANPNGYDFSDVAISPLDPSNILVGDVGNAFYSDAHVYFSIDAGDNWGEFPFSYWTIHDVEPDPLVPTDFYVATEFGGLLRRDNVIEVNGGGDFAICPSDNQLLFLGAGDTLGVGISTDGGGTWSYSGEGLPLHSTSWVNSILVHPNDCTKIFVGIQTSSNPAIHTAHWSTDSGATFPETGWNFGQVNEVVFDPTVGSQGVIFAGSPQGVHRFPLDTMEWIDLSSGLVGDAIWVNGIAAVNGVRLIAGTNDGIWSLGYLPSLSIAARKVDDSVTGDGSGSAEPGEQVGLSVYLYNIMFEAQNLTGTLSTNDPNMTIDDGEASFPNIQPLGVDGNSADPFLVTVDPAAEYGHRANFDLALTSNAGGFNDTLSFSLEVGHHIILIVDDDEGQTYEDYYTATLDTLDQTDSLPNIYDLWDVKLYGSVAGIMQAPWTHDPVIWYTGNAAENTLTAEDRQAITDFLFDGHNMLITGQNIAEDLRGTGFLLDTLGIDWADTNALPICHGIEGDPLSGEMLDILTQGAMGANNQDSRDELTIPVRNPGTEPTILYDPDAFSIAGVRVEKQGGRMIFLGFGFEAVNNSNSPMFESRTSMMQKMLIWLRHPVGIEGESEEPEFSLPMAFSLNQNYPNPFNPQTSISYSVPGSDGDLVDVTLKVYSIRGRLVKKLVDEKKESGGYTVVWDGRDETGREVSSGIYFYRLEAGDRIAVRKMVILK